MNKTTKGGIAAAASAALLLGGAGSLAYWNTTDTFSAGDFVTGDLKLVADDCEDNDSRWVLTNEVDPSVNEILPAQEYIDYRAVPGDVLTKECVVDIVAVGDNLRANLGIANGDTEGGQLETVSAGPDGVVMNGDDYDVNVTFELDDVPAAQLDSADDGKSIDVTFVVSFPLRANTLDNKSKVDTLDLGAYTVTATQVRS